MVIRMVIIKMASIRMGIISMVKKAIKSTANKAIVNLATRISQANLAQHAQIAAAEAVNKSLLTITAAITMSLPVATAVIVNLVS